MSTDSTDYLGWGVIMLTAICVAGITQMVKIKSATGSSSDAAEQSSVKSINFGWMFFWTVVAHGFVLYIPTTGLSNYTGDEYRYNVLIALVFILWTANILGFGYKCSHIAKQDRWAVSGEGFVKLPVVCNSPGLVQSVLLGFDNALLIAFVIVNIVYINTQDYDAGGWSSWLLTTSGIVFVVIMILHRVAYKIHYAKDPTMTTKPLLAARLLAVGMPLNLSETGEPMEISTEKLKSKRNMYAVLPTTEGKASPVALENPKGSLLHIARLMIGSDANKEIVEKHGLTPKDFKILHFNDVFYAVNSRNSKRIVNMLPGAELAHTDRLMKVTTGYETKALSVVDETETEQVTDLERLGAGYVCFEEKVWGYINGYAIWVDMGTPALGCFVMMMLPFYIKFLDNTLDGFMTWALTVWPALFAALNSRKRGSFWELFRYCYLMYWTFVIILGVVAPTDLQFIVRNMGITTIYPGIAAWGSTSLDQSSTYAGICVVAFVVAVCSLIVELMTFSSGMVSRINFNFC